MARLKIGFIPIEGGTYYKEALEEVTRAEELGFDSVWMEEHHSVTNHYWPSPLTVLAGFATRTTRMMLGTDIIVAAFHHPVRLAEEHIMIAYRKEYAGGWRHPFIDASIATDLDRLMADRFIVGGPEQCVAQVRRFTEEYGMTHLICRTFFPGMPHAHIMRELELIAREVAPAFK